MDLRLALGLAEALERPSFPEGVGLEVYLDPGLLEEDEPFRQLVAKRPKRLSVHLPFWNLDQDQVELKQSSKARLLPLGYLGLGG